MTFTIRDPSGATVFSKASIDQGNFAFTTDKQGLHEFCFQDIAGTYSHRHLFVGSAVFLPESCAGFTSSFPRSLALPSAKLPEKDRKAKLVTWTGADAKDFAAIAKKVWLCTQRYTFLC